MLSIRFESIGVDLTTGLHVFSGTYVPPAEQLHSQSSLKQIREKIWMHQQYGPYAFIRYRTFIDDL